MDNKLKAEAIKDLKVIDPDMIPHVLEEGEVGLALEWMVSDPITGKVQEHVIKKAESFVRGFLDLLFVMMNHVSKCTLYDVLDTGNVQRTVHSHYENLQTNGGVADVDCGIVIGTSAVAPTVNDYVLGARIAHATMNYGAMTYGLPTSDATTSQCTLTRNFANVSGGAVTVQEIGLYADGWYGQSLWRVLIARDVTGGIAVPNGQTLTVNYRPQCVV